MFLLHVIDLHQASKVLNQIMFAEDTNLSFLPSDIHILFEKMNKELANVSNRFNASKLKNVINVKKTIILSSKNHQKQIIFHCGF